jgi:predicted phosphohydrolase
MAVYAIGDLHLSFGTDKPMDIFTGWNDYVERLEKNWKKLITDTDTVVVDGDISWGINYSQALADLKWIDSLPGRKILIKGNHDLWWDTMNKNQKLVKENSLSSIEFLFNNTFAVENCAVCGTRSWFFDAEKNADKKVLTRECGRLQRSVESALQTGLEPIVFLHYPPLTQNEECTEITDILRANKIKKCFYAHMHGRAAAAAFNGKKYGIDFKLISADTLSFCPYLIKK